MKLKMYTQKDMMLDGIIMAILKPTSTQGDFTLSEYGKGFVPSTEGIMVFIEEKFVLDLEDNFKLEMDAYFQPSLVTKSGVNYEPPEEDYLTVQARELENQLKLIKEEKYKREMEIAPPEDEEAELAKIDRELAERARKMEEEALEER